MPIKLGVVEALFRYPVKSMRGEPLDSVEVDWHGIAGDRRLALRRLPEQLPDRLLDQGGFPWLTASKLPELILFAPGRPAASAETHLPTHVRTPDGDELALFSPELAAEIGRRLGSPVQMMHLRQGIFDEAGISLITGATVDEVARLSAMPADVRRFRPNIVIRSQRAEPFEEDAWVGGALQFGDGGEAVRLGVTMRDERCAMVNLDPDTARSAPELLKTIVRVADNRLGVYGTVTRRGRLRLGQTLYLEPQVGSAEHG